jgi:ribonuclease P protein component
MGELALSKADRILKRSGFLWLSKTGHRLHHRYFLVVYLPGTTDRVRLGITVTRKVGNAVCRNRIKRHCREFFRKHRSRISGIWDINLIAKKEVAGVSADRIDAALMNLFDRMPRGS